MSSQYINYLLTGRLKRYLYLSEKTRLITDPEHCNNIQLKIHNISVDKTVIKKFIVIKSGYLYSLQ